jgi:hypothetical protein
MAVKPETNYYFYLASPSSPPSSPAMLYTCCICQVHQSLPFWTFFKVFTTSTFTNIRTQDFCLMEKDTKTKVNKNNRVKYSLDKVCLCI